MDVILQWNGCNWPHHPAGRASASSNPSCLLSSHSLSTRLSQLSLVSSVLELLYPLSFPVLSRGRPLLDREIRTIWHQSPHSSHKTSPFSQTSVICYLCLGSHLFSLFQGPSAITVQYFPDIPLLSLFTDSSPFGLNMLTFYPFMQKTPLFFSPPL